MNEDLVLAITMLIILAVVVLFIQISQQIKVKRIQKVKIQEAVWRDFLIMEEIRISDSRGSVSIINTREGKMWIR